MSLSSSLSAGVAGLSANATRLATISDNIANSGTYGYKQAETEFSALVLTGNQGSGVYSAGGVLASTTRLIQESGALVSTSNATDLAISGRGMLPVTTVDSIDNSGDEPMMMTTTGSFHTDEDGVLKTDSGLVLLGWPADADGSIATYARDTVSDLEPVVINANQTAGDPTTEMNLGVNLPAEDADGDYPLSVEYFGNLGTSESLDIVFSPSTTTDNTWTMTMSDSASNDATIGEYTLVFDDTREQGGTLFSVTATTNNPATSSYTSSSGVLSLEVDGGSLDVTIGQLGDTNGLTQLSDSFSPTSIIKDGSPVGNLTSVEVDENGYMTATYDTGFTRTIYQIPIVDVPNYNGLTSLSDQAYQVSPSSGSFFLWDAGDGPTGAVIGYSRESSTTDVASELTDLIQTQRAYSSNAKVIQTVDEMLQETTNIKR
ncbi:flagellar hook-basal body complex protein [Pacificibacter sp. AS14]|uniref:flagellar hook protein FlgE n=1 Tax=Pacificibacter sp. AS14 TaxID=3135785 RepID=UPI003177C74A